MPEQGWTKEQPKVALRVSPAKEPCPVLEQNVPHLHPARAFEAAPVITGVLRNHGPVVRPVEPEVADEAPAAARGRPLGLVLSQTADSHAVTPNAGHILDAYAVRPWFDGDAIITSPVNEVRQGYITSVHCVFRGKGGAIGRSHNVLT
ncbi:hypothetical protein DL767_010998 [Monosporascus sp. MG133]|nr:hypothetical protein DL767_010998 [Monosporascus sp. MG133]